MKQKDIYNDTIMDNETGTSEKKTSVVLYYLLLALCIAISVYTFIAARNEGVIALGNIQLPVSAFAGVLSTITNICLIFMVVYFHKRGFITSIVILLVQLPLIVQGIIMSKALTSIPGLFGTFFTLIAIIMIYRRNKKIADYQRIEIGHFIEKQFFTQRLFEQTATALVNAIDAKDTYSRGHSVRVAEYSEKIARAMGKSDEECRRIYYAALLHDVGKIGISDEIINKKGKLTEEEYDAIKQHPVLGSQILSSISEYPYLSIGAHHHHERYDGKGYPDKLKGEDIPEIARIIAVADAYDAMTSTRSYRAAIPQQLVREEIVKNSGTQFDPEVAKVMQHIIDLDTEYRMKERSTVQELAGKSELHCGNYRSEISEGIIVSPFMTTIRLNYLSDDKPWEKGNAPTMILFDSLDGRVHKDEAAKRDLNYYEYGEIRFDGETICSGARKIEVIISDKKREDRSSKEEIGPDGREYTIETVRYKDHALFKIDDGKKLVTVTVALPDNTRYSYIGLTGKNCHISNVRIDKSKELVSPDYIPRIAEEVSFIKGQPEGDVPNLQIDGFRMQSTKGIPITDGMQIIFHTKSLPTARLIWHCPYIDIFYSEDAEVRGKGYLDYALIRLDGENWHGEGIAENKLIVNKNEFFQNWDVWKRRNKEGIDITVTFIRQGNKVVVITESLGVCLKNTTTVLTGKEEIYAALTGDQCALTNIRIVRQE